MTRTYQTVAEAAQNLKDWERANPAAAGEAAAKADNAAARLGLWPAERRQLAKVLEFTSTQAPYINWNGIAQTARELGSHFEARYADDGACTVILFWSYADGEED